MASCPIGSQRPDSISSDYANWVGGDCDTRRRPASMDNSLTFTEVRLERKGVVKILLRSGRTGATRRGSLWRLYDNDRMDDAAREQGGSL